MSDMIVRLAIIVYNFCLVAGTAYLVALHDWSMWSFLLTMCFIMSATTRRESDGKNSKETTETGN